MDLDDRLREIFRPFVGNIYGERTDKAVVEIKQAFEDSEEWFNRGPIVLREDATDYIPVVMSGSEWYERFEKELTEHTVKYMTSMPKYDEYDVLQAAKRASGIDKEGVEE